jgi:4-hydroxybenzoate polyprenyltransferase
MCLEKLCGKCCEMHKSKLNCALHLIAFIVLIYALWVHSIELILAAFLIAILGHIIQAVKDKKPKSQAQKKRKKR